MQVRRSFGTAKCLAKASQLRQRGRRQHRSQLSRARTRDGEHEQSDQHQQQQPSKDLIVTYKPKEREVAPAPEEAPIIHSSSYILQERQGGASTSQSQQRSYSSSSSSGSSSSKSKEGAGGQEEVSSGNALDWALRQADSYFDRVENDEATRKSANNVVSNPVTQTTLRTLQGVTSFGAAAAPHVLRAAMPVGKKLLSATASTVMMGAGAFSDASKKNRERRRQKQLQDAESEAADSGSDAGRRR